jgi:hypothetical protein
VAWGGRVPGYRQIYVQGATLATFRTGTEGNFTLPDFKVMTPDSRLRVKVTILFTGDGIIFPTPLATLALVELEQDYTGSSGTLVESVAVDPPAPGGTISLPLAPGLLGYSREFVTAGDAIQGSIVLAPGFGAGGEVVIQARWQPDGQRLPAEEWDEIVTFCSLVVPQVRV